MQILFQIAYLELAKELKKSCPMLTSCDLVIVNPDSSPYSCFIAHLWRATDNRNTEAGILITKMLM
jgi:hypothetical protein